MGSFVSSIWLFTWSFHYLFILKELFVMVRVALARIRSHLVPFFALADGTWTTDTLPTAQLPCMLFSPHAVDGVVVPCSPSSPPPRFASSYCRIAKGRPDCRNGELCVVRWSACIFDIFVLVSTACVVSSLRPICFVPTLPMDRIHRYPSDFLANVSIFAYCFYPPLTQVRSAAEQHRGRLPRGREGPDRIHGRDRDAAPAGTAGDQDDA